MVHEFTKQHKFKFKQFFLILSASLRSSTFFELRAISDRDLIISKNRSLTAVIVFILLDHLVGFNFFKVTSDSLVNFDNRSQRLYCFPKNYTALVKL